MVVPEEWVKYLDGLGKHVASLKEYVSNDLSRVSSETRENSLKITSMTETYMQLQSALDEKDSEIKRLKDGYDTEIFRRFISRFIRIDQTIDEFILDEGESTALSQLSRLFEDALEECSVSKYEPEIGEDYREAYGIADNPKKELTKDSNKNFKIIEVIESGYHIDTGKNKKIIIPSKVKIYSKQ